MLDYNVKDWVCWDGLNHVSVVSTKFNAAVFLFCFVFFDCLKKPIYLLNCFQVIFWFPEVHWGYLGDWMYLQWLLHSGAVRKYHHIVISLGGKRFPFLGKEEKWLAGVMGSAVGLWQRHWNVWSGFRSLTLWDKGKKNLKKKKLVQHFKSSIYIYSTNVHSETFRGRRCGGAIGKEGGNVTG